MPHALITPRLHMLGLRIRQMHSLHEAYLTLIQRILEPRSNSANNFGALSSNRRGVVLAPSAAQRFERLGDRIHVLILSPTPELLSDKDALVASVLLPTPSASFLLISYPVFQYSCSKRLRSDHQIDQRSHPPRQTQRAIPTCQSHDELLLYTNQ